MLWLVFCLAIRLVYLSECGRFHEPEPKQRDQPEPCARAVRYSVGRAVRTHDHPESLQGEHEPRND
jgi:hypothetical protein